ncbi:MAG: S41 family peptidase [Erysipelotrichaceae bacterium]|nr:S41 family peptidase [Erysipelotrichaceae bacterium]
MSDNQEPKKVQIKLERHLWPDEQAALKHKRQKRFKIFLLVFLLVCSVSGSLFLGIYIGTQNTKQAYAEDSTAFSRFKTIYQTLLNNWYFINEIDDPENTLIERAIDGMIGTDYDLHTDYMTADEVEAFAESIDMGFSGIGIQYNIVEDKVMIEKVYRDSPAFNAGLQPGDMITEVNHVSVAGWDSDKLVSEVKGEEGTVVNITYLRQNEEYNVDITRGIVENSVYGEILEGNIGYLQISQFSTAAPSEVKKYLEYFSESSVTKLIIDLRDDGGGYLTSLIGVASLFLEKDEPILIQEYADGTSETSYATGGNFTEFTKIVILGNENSASASEAFIGCMRDNGKATFVGVTTYGKSTVQVPVYFSDGSALKYSKALWLTPNRNVINKIGLIPDVVVQLHPVLNMSMIVLDNDEYYEYDQVDDNILIAQNCLDFLGYDVDRLDGYFDRATETAIQAFQNDYGLSVTGKLDADTASLLGSEVVREWNLNTDKYDTQKAKAIELLNE